MPGPIAPVVVLTDEERETLQRWAARPSSAQALALRCRIVLACAEGGTNLVVAGRLGVSRGTVRKWRARFVADRLDGLGDEPRPGAPRKITDADADADVEKVIVKTLEDSPRDSTHWSTRSMASSVRIFAIGLVRIRKVREAIGSEIGLMLDANNCWDAATAARFANRVADQNPMFLEEPVFADDIPGLARFKRDTDIPLATGEHEYTRFGVRDLLINDAVDIVQVDGARAGGYTEMLKIAALTQAWNVKFAPHAMENFHLPLVAAMPNAPFLERLLMFEGITAQAFPNAELPHDGMMTVSTKPGHGLEPDLDFVLSTDGR